MGPNITTSLAYLLVGDELGQIKLIQLDPKHVNSCENETYFKLYGQEAPFCTFDDLHAATSNQGPCQQKSEELLENRSKTLGAGPRNHSPHTHRIVKIFADCLQQEPAASRAILGIRPIESIYESNLDTTDKANNLFLITNKVGQIFLCDTNSVRSRLQFCNLDNDHATNNFYNKINDDDDDTKAHFELSPILSPIYYNMNNKIPLCGAQPINQTNILVVYQNGDIQHVSIGQDILQSSLRFKRKAIRMLGLGYNSDARAVHWRIDGATGVCYYDSDASSAHMSETDPLMDMALSSPTHKLGKKRTDRSQHDQYHKSPCVQSRKYNEQDQLIPMQVISMITNHIEQERPSTTRICKWSSITSLNLIYKKLALYDLISPEISRKSQERDPYKVCTYKLNDQRLAVGGANYCLRVYDVPTQKAIYNSLTGSSRNPLMCPSKGDPTTISDIDWLGGNKTTRRSPNLLAVCSGVDSIINVYDLRSPKPVFFIDMTHQTENKWQPYENHPRGCTFTSICASSAPYSTAVPSQQLALGSTNGQLHLIDLRFVARSQRTLGKLSGFCGGLVREIRFVSESFETSKMVSCATDRFVRVHRIQTSFNSVISQKLATKVFLGTRPTCVQPVCDEIDQGHITGVISNSESQISTNGSGSWSLL